MLGNGYWDMQIALLADVHGNLPALEAVLQEVRRHGVEGVIVAGDFVGGPQPQETADLLLSIGSWMVRGNTEEYCLAYHRGKFPTGWQESKQWAATRWSCSRLKEETFGAIAAIPEQRVVALDGTALIRVVHGSPRSLGEQLFPDRDPHALTIYRQAGILPWSQEPPRLRRSLAQVEEPVLVCGHSHIPWIQEEDGLLVVNAGSVGGPINGDWRAQVALLRWEDGRWQAEHRLVAYDLERIRAAYHDSGYLAAGGAFARACLLATESGENVPGRLVAHVWRVVAQAGYAGAAVVPDTLWDQAVASFPWQVRA